MSAPTPAPTPAEPAAPTARPRTWPALLALLILPGLTAETLTGSTPILVYLTNPISLLGNILIYGSGAILIREVARRRGLGWINILLLGAAYGIFEEGLVVNTWANPWLPQVCRVAHGTTTGLCDYSRVGNINLAFAAETTVFHAIISISVPILLVELILPRRAAGPWLGRKAPFAFVGAEVLVLAAGLIANIADFRKHGLAGPFAAPYVIEIALMALLITLALAIKPAARDPGAQTAASRRVPRLWTLRAFGFLLLAVVVLLPGVFQGAHVPFQLALTVYGALLALAGARVATWARRAGWDDRHRLALASGAVGFFLLVWDPILEIAGTAGGSTTHGTGLVALAYLIFLIVLARRVARRVQAAGGEPPMAVLAAISPGAERDGGGA
jgi:hypothetical protein